MNTSTTLTKNERQPVVYRFLSLSSIASLWIYFVTAVRWKYVVLMAALLILWSSSYVGIRISLESYSASNLAFLRYFTASVAFIPVALLFKVRVPRLADLPGVSLLGLIGFAVYNLLLNSGERTINAGIASVIISATPFFTMLLAILLKEEKAARKDWTGLIIAFLGVNIIVVTQTTGAAFDLNSIYLLLAAFCMGLYFVLQKRYFGKYSPIELTSYAVWSGTAILFFFTEDIVGSVMHAKQLPTLSVIYLGVFPGMIAFLIMAYILKEYKASNASSYLFLIPFFAVLIGWLVLDEMPGMNALIGGLFIIAGVMVKNSILRKAS